MTIGNKVKICRDNYYDYGRLLGKEGTIIAGGNEFNGTRRWLVEFDKNTIIHVLEPDLDLL